jgi:AcrR family transcriptional regulator
MPVTAPSEATRIRILDAAVDAFAERGYRGTSVRTIAASAGANVAAINYHFGSKERLWTAVCTRCSQQVGQAVQGALRFPLVPEQVLDDVLGAIFDLFAEDQRPVRVLVWVWMQADSMDFEAAADTFQPLVDLCFQYIEHLQSQVLRAARLLLGGTP